MTNERGPLICPVCGSELERGFVSYCSGSIWHREKPQGLGRLFWNAFSSGARVFGSFASYPTVSSIRASRCSGCSSVLITPGEDG